MGAYGNRLAAAKTIDISLSNPRAMIEILERRILMSQFATPVVIDCGINSYDYGAPIVVFPPSTTPSANALSLGAAPIYGEHNKPFAGTVAHFSDPTNAATAADFQVTIDWGDGTTSQGAIVANADGGFDVVGSHQWIWGTYQVQITVEDTRDGSDLAATSTCQAVIDAPPMAGQAFAIGATSGREFTQIIGRFVGLDLSLLDRYSATVQWGDSQTSEATLVDLGNGVVGVQATHLYERSGFFDVQIRVSPDDQSAPRYYWANDGAVTAYTRATVLAGPLVGDVVLSETTLTSGDPFSGTVARFSLTDPQDDVSHYVAEIDWGGAGIGNSAGVLQRVGDRVELTNQFVPMTEGAHRITVRIYDTRQVDSPVVAVASGDIVVRQHLDFNYTGVYATGGVEFSGVVTSFHSTGSSGLWNSQFTATIDWGDGQTSQGTIVANDEGGWDVIGQHTYATADARRYLYVSAVVTETRTPAIAGLPTPAEPYTLVCPAWAWIEPGASTSITIEINSFACQTSEIGVAREYMVGFLTIGELAPQTDQLSGEIVWEDGTVSPLQIGMVWGQQCSLSAQLQFDSVGYRSGTVYVYYGEQSRSASIRFLVTEPAPAPLAEVVGQSVDASCGQEWSGIVGRFRLYEPVDTLDALNVQISWGDGHISTASSLEVRDDGWVNVYGSHTYTRTLSGNYGSLSVQMGARRSSGWGLYVEVIRNPNVINAEGKYLQFRQREQFTAVVATFTSPIASATADDYEVWIDWGDGTQSRGAVTRRYDGGFDVSGTNTYHDSSWKQISVRITGPGGTTLTTGSISLERNPIVVNEGSDVQTTGLEITGRLATFSDDDLAATSSSVGSRRIYHAALLDWGDGEISQGLIAQREDGTFEVLGSHTYATEGQYQVRLVVRQTTCWSLGYVTWGDGVRAFNATAATGGLPDVVEVGALLFTVTVHSQPTALPTDVSGPEVTDAEAAVPMPGASVATARSATSLIEAMEQDGASFDTGSSPLLGRQTLPDGLLR